MNDRIELDIPPSDRVTLLGIVTAVTMLQASTEALVAAVNKNTDELRRNRDD